MTIISMLSYVAHIPHSPLLLPQIARNKFRQFKKMHQAVAQIKHDLYCRGCETLILLSPYASPHQAHLLNVSPQFSASFEPYGSFGAVARFPGDIATAYRIRARLGTSYPMAAVTRRELDGATAAAALQLSVPDAPCRLLPIYASAESPLSALYEFGKKLRDVLEFAGEKIGVVSLGDLSRTAPSDREAGRKLDQSIIRSLKENRAEGLFSAVGLPFSLGALKGLSLVLGLLDGVAHEAEVLNYEQKYGVGMMAARFV